MPARSTPSFEAFIAALISGKADDFLTIPRDRRAATELNIPQAAISFDLVGFDDAATVLARPPTFARAAMASDLAEVSWLSLTRDIAFREYESNPLICWHRRRSLDERSLFPQMADSSSPAARLRRMGMSSMAGGEPCCSYCRSELSSAVNRLQ